MTFGNSAHDDTINNNDNSIKTFQSIKFNKKIVLFAPAITNQSNNNNNSNTNSDNAHNYRSEKLCLNHIDDDELNGHDAHVQA